jgi:AcrR family transcriptional regulator
MTSQSHTNHMPKATFFNLPTAKRERIIAIAVDEFAENDYDRASISKIVAQVGIAKGSFYQYFEDKADLYHYLLAEGSRLKRLFLAEHPPPDPHMGLFIYLRWLYRVGMHTEFAHPKLAKVAQRALYGKGPLSETWVRSIRQEGRLFFKDLIELGVRNHQLRSDLDTDLAAYLCYATAQDLGQYLMERIGATHEIDIYEAFQHHDAEVEIIFDHFLHILEHGMGNPRSVS